MSTPNRVVRGLRVVTPEGVRPAALHLHDGVISRVAGYDEVPEGAKVDDVGDLVLMPGIVDTHVHVNEPGRTEWEGFATATRAAAAGGVTTLMDMPLNSIPPTTSVAGLEAKAKAAEGKCFVDVALCGGAVPGNAADLRAIRDAGALAFKCFLAESGVLEFKHLEEADLEKAMRALADLGVPLLVHAELPAPLEEAARIQGTLSPSDARRYASYLASRPKTAEDAAIDLVLRLAEKFGTRAHVVHLSAATALPLFRRAKDKGLPVSVETCPHYLHFASDRIVDGATAFKCAPPIREESNRLGLWDALREGLLDQVVSDHSPAPAALKCTDSGDFMKAWGGISSLQLGLRVVWSEVLRIEKAGASTLSPAARARAIANVARWMCEGPAKLVGLYGKKGVFAPGADADFAVWDDGESVAPVHATALEHRHKITPYEGESLGGIVVSTWLRGEKIFERDALRDPGRGSATSLATPDGRFLGTPRGVWLRKGRA